MRVKSILACNGVLRETTTQSSRTSNNNPDRIEIEQNINQFARSILHTRKQTRRIKERKWQRSLTRDPDKDWDVASTERAAPKKEEQILPSSAESSEGRTKSKKKKVEGKGRIKNYFKGVKLMGHIWPTVQDKHSQEVHQCLQDNALASVGY